MDAIREQKGNTSWVDTSNECECEWHLHCVRRDPKCSITTQGDEAGDLPVILELPKQGQEQQLWQCLREDLAGETWQHVQ